MHELSIAESLLAIIEQEALHYGNARVTWIKLRVGNLSGIVPDALKFAFEVISKGGCAEGAQLDIELLPFEIRCNVCNKIFIQEEPFMICPQCEGLDVELISGRELEIEKKDF
jgi:hydrogenase nickel incorporation protein HypA/HybF